MVLGENVKTTTRLFAIGALVLLAGTGVAAATAMTAAPAEARSECRALAEAGETDAARECVRAHLASLLKARAKREMASRWPAFEAGNGSVEGRFVSFGTDAATGSIVDYRVHGGFATTTLFERIDLTDTPAENLSGRAHGPLYLGRGDGEGLVVFNAPNAAWVYGTRAGGVVTLQVGEGIAVAEADAMRVRVSNGMASAVLLVKGEGAIEVAEDGALVATLGPGSALAFAIEGHPRLVEWEKRVLARLREG